jgi:hypothetical protein
MIFPISRSTFWLTPHLASLYRASTEPYAFKMLCSGYLFSEQKIYYLLSAVGPRSKFAIALPTDC